MNDTKLEITQFLGENATFFTIHMSPTVNSYPQVINLDTSPTQLSTV
jgi:hypothetical protein